MVAIEWIQALLGLRWQLLFLSLTYLGSEYAYIVLLTLYYWLVDPWAGRQLGLLMGLSTGFNTLLKELFMHPRPFDLNPSLASPAARATIEGSAFPSAHAQSSATFWFYVAWHHRHLWLWGLSLVLISLVSVSRLYLGVHFPMDISGGLVLGVLMAWIGTQFSCPIRRPWPLVLISVVALAFLLAVLWPQLGRSLGVITGFFLTKPHFTPPSTWKGRLRFGGIGLLSVLAFYSGSGWLLSSWRHQGWVIYWRYCTLTLFTTEVWPRLARGKDYP